MGIASTEIRRISPARPRLSVAAEVSGSLVSRTADPLGGGTLPVLPALRELLPRGGLARGSVVTVAEFGLLILALAAGASADGAWCGIAGVPEAGVLAAAALGLDADFSKHGMGTRSQRYSMLVVDGVVKQLNVESGGFEVSSAEKLLSQLG